MPPHAQRGLGSLEVQIHNEARRLRQSDGGENHSARRLAVQGNAMRHRWYQARPSACAARFRFDRPVHRQGGCQHTEP